MITLGIIGVVAAMTIPVLIQNHRKQVVETRLKKFYSTINQAIQLSETENGDKKYWVVMSDDFSALDWYEKYLKKYVKTVKVDSFVDASNKERLLLYFPDGSATIFNHLSWYFFPESKDFEYCTNLERYAKCVGKKMFTFYFSPNSTNIYHKDKGVEPYKLHWDGTESWLLTHPTTGCNNDATNERAYCTALIQQNGWKIPDNYPLRF